MRIIIAMACFMLITGTARAQCTIPGCEEATAVVSAARATARAVLTREAPTPAPTSTPAPTATAQPTATPMPQPTTTATSAPTATPTPLPMATSTMQPTTTSTPQSTSMPASRNESGITPAIFFVIALVFLVLIALFIWIAVKALIKAVTNGN